MVQSAACWYSRYYRAMARVMRRADTLEIIEMSVAKDELDHLRQLADVVAMAGGGVACMNALHELGLPGGYLRVLAAFSGDASSLRHLLSSKDADARKVSPSACSLWAIFSNAPRSLDVVTLMRGMYRTHRGAAGYRVEVQAAARFRNASVLAFCVSDRSAPPCVMDAVLEHCPGDYLAITNVAISSSEKPEALLSKIIKSGDASVAAKALSRCSSSVFGNASYCRIAAASGAVDVLAYLVAAGFAKPPPDELMGSAVASKSVAMARYVFETVVAEDGDVCSPRLAHVALKNGDLDMLAYLESVGHGVVQSDKGALDALLRADMGYLTCDKLVNLLESLERAGVDTRSDPRVVAGVISDLDTVSKLLWHGYAVDAACALDALRLRRRDVYWLLRREAACPVNDGRCAIAAIDLGCMDIIRDVFSEFKPDNACLQRAVKRRNLEVLDLLFLAWGMELGEDALILAIETRTADRVYAWTPLVGGRLGPRCMEAALTSKDADIIDYVASEVNSECFAQPLVVLAAVRSGRTDFISEDAIDRSNCDFWKAAVASGEIEIFERVVPEILPPACPNCVLVMTDIIAADRPDMLRCLVRRGFRGVHASKAYARQAVRRGAAKVLAEILGCSTRA